MGVQVSGDVVVGEVWAVVLVLFEAVSSLGFDVGFLFPRVMLSRFVALFPLVLRGRGRGRCGVWVSGVYIGAADPCLCAEYGVVLGQFESRGGIVVLLFSLG